MSTQVNVSESTFFVTGANRGIGREIVRSLLKHGAKKVYASARQTDGLADLVSEGQGRVEPVTLDVTKPAQIEAAVTAAPDVDVLINNAGVLHFNSSSTTDQTDGRTDFEVNVFGMANVTNAFLPQVKASANGAVSTLLSVASVLNFPPISYYSASKAAAESLVQGYRAELAADGKLVQGVYPGPIDTDMAEALPLEKTPPDVVANEIVEGLAAGAEEVYPDPMAKQFIEAYRADAKALERQNAQMVQQPA